MDFSFTEEQLAIRAAIEKVCADFGDDYWLKKDREGGFPHDFHAALAGAGWLGVAMPTEMGGAGLGITEAAIIMQTVAESGAALPRLDRAHEHLGLHPVVVFGTKEQQRDAAAADLGEHKAAGVTEPNTGLNMAQAQDQGCAMATTMS
jgi:acyl-CoA dehydrogenase